MCVGGMITAVTFTNKTRSKAGCKEEKSRQEMAAFVEGPIMQVYDPS